MKMENNEGGSGLKIDSGNVRGNTNAKWNVCAAHPFVRSFVHSRVPVRPSVRSSVE
jgi:hypothetical protein